MNHTPSQHRALLECERLEDRLALDATSYVTSLYHNLLMRDPDSSGLSHFVTEINNGESNAQVANEFWVSPEHRGVEVDAYFQQFLHRSADPSGRAHWINEMVNNGVGELQVAFDFLVSNEFVANHNTPQAYVTGVYLTVLARLPSNDEQAFWQDQMARNGIGAVAGGVLTSQEAFTGIISNDYMTYLNRKPDANGLDAWLSQLETGRGSVQSVAVGILGSAEYAAKH